MSTRLDGVVFSDTARVDHDSFADPVLGKDVERLRVILPYTVDGKDSDKMFAVFVHDVEGLDGDTEMVTMAATELESLKAEIVSLRDQRDAVTEVINGSSAHAHLDKFREVDVALYDNYQRWFQVCAGLLLELDLGSCYEDTPGLFAMRVKKRLAEKDAEIRTLENRQKDDVEDYEECSNCGCDQWVYWTAENDLGDPSKEPVLHCMSCERDEAQRAIRELPVAIGLMSVAGKAGDWEKFNRLADEVIEKLGSESEIAVTMYPRKKALQLLANWTPEMIDALVRELLVGRCSDMGTGLDIFVELCKWTDDVHDWMKKHSYPQGSTDEPPKPFGGDAEVKVK